MQNVAPICIIDLLLASTQFHFALQCQMRGYFGDFSLLDTVLRISEHKIKEPPLFCLKKISAALTGIYFGPFWL
jgi:hypothetical protein